MGTMIELTAADGHKLAAYRAEPSGKPRGGLVVIQEIFGVNSHIKSVADGYAEREAATLMVCTQWQRAPGRRRTVGADKAYDVGDFVGLLRELKTTPHVTQNVTRSGGSSIDERTTRHAGYAKSQHARPRIEPAFGWLKTIAWMRKVKLRGLPKVDWLFVFASAAFNLIRLPKLLPRPA